MECIIEVAGNGSRPHRRNIRPFNWSDGNCGIYYYGALLFEYDVFPQKFADHGLSLEDYPTGIIVENADDPGYGVEVWVPRGTVLSINSRYYPASFAGRMWESGAAYVNGHETVAVNKAAAAILGTPIETVRAKGDAQTGVILARLVR